MGWAPFQSTSFPKSNRFSWPSVIEKNGFLPVDPAYLQSKNYHTRIEILFHYSRRDKAGYRPATDGMYDFQNPVPDRIPPVESIQLPHSIDYESLAGDMAGVSENVRKSWEQVLLRAIP